MSWTSKRWPSNALARCACLWPRRSTPFAEGLGLRGFSRLFDHGVVVRQRLLARALPGPANDARVVDDEDRPSRHAGVSGHVVPAHAVVGDHLALEITDQVIGQPAALFGKRLVRDHRIDADSVDADAVRCLRIMP